MAHDIRGSAETGRLARSGGRGSVRFPNATPMAAGAHALDADARRNAVRLSPAAAVERVIASGIFERIAAEMTRTDREIKATATPTPPFNEVMAKCKGPIVAMRGWAL